jgi:hypothetical protein
MSGGMTVGLMADLDAIEAAAVMRLRLWPGSGPPVGPSAGGDGREVLAAVAALCRHAVDHARRPILRHDPAGAPAPGQSLRHITAAASITSISARWPTAAPPAVAPPAAAPPLIGSGSACRRG